MTTIDGKKTLLVYLDEAGDTNFGDSGTKRFLYTALVLAGEGFPLHRALLECRYEIIAANGRFSNSHENNDYFHATEDSLETRDKVFPVLKAHASDARVYTLVADKSTFPDEERSQGALFEHAASALLRTVIGSEGVREGYDRICIMLDNIPVQKRKREIRGAIKKAVAAALAGSGVTYAIMPMASKSDLCLQAVDYFSWAMYRKWESGDASQVARLGGNVIEIPYDFSG